MVDELTEKREHWAKSLGATTKPEQKLMDDLVNATYPLRTVSAGSTSSSLLVGTSSGTTWINPVEYSQTFDGLAQRVRALEAKVGRMEKALVDAGKSDWDEFEELTG